MPEETLSLLPKFNAWRKIPRLLSPVTLTEKIDGTNAVIFVPEEKAAPLVAGRRTDWLRPGEADNYGFRAFVETNQETLRQLGPGLHYGEWYGQGIQRNYGLDHKRLALFNPDMDEVLTVALRAIHVGVVPVLARFDTFSSALLTEVMEMLYTNGSQAVPGFLNPEGIVIRHEKSGQLFKLPFEASKNNGAK